MIRNCYGPNVCILLRIVCWNPNPTTWWYLEVRPLDIVRCRWIQEDAAKSAKSLQLCPTLCDPIDASPPGSPVPGILQARTLEWVAISFSNEWKWKAKVTSLSRVQLLATPWTAAHQPPPSMGFSRQEYWSGVPLPSPVKRADLGNSANCEQCSWKTWPPVLPFLVRPRTLDRTWNFSKS